MTRSVGVIGVGMTKFGKYPQQSLKSLTAQAVDRARKDARIPLDQLQGAFVGSAMTGITTGQESLVAQVVLSPMGIEGIPMFSINNACASSGTAFHLAVQWLAAGLADLALVVGVEKLVHPDAHVSYRAINNAIDQDWLRQQRIDPSAGSVFMEFYAAKFLAYQAAYGVNSRVLAEIAEKNHDHSVGNPWAQYQKPLTVDQILESPMVVDPITAYMCAPISDGAAACVLAAGDILKTRTDVVFVKGSAVTTGSSTAEETASRRAAKTAYRSAHMAPKDIHCAEVHDGNSASELLLYEELGFADAGDAINLIQRAETRIGGKIPVNMSGGLISKGNPSGATGASQIVEAVWQLRGEAYGRQVKGAETALCHNAGGHSQGDSAAVAVHILSVRAS